MVCKEMGSLYGKLGQPSNKHQVSIHHAEKLTSCVAGLIPIS